MLQMLYATDYWRSVTSVFRRGYPISISQSKVFTNPHTRSRRSHIFHRLPACCSICVNSPVPLLYPAAFVSPLASRVTPELWRSWRCVAPQARVRVHARVYRVLVPPNKIFSTYTYIYIHIHIYTCIHTYWGLGLGLTRRSDASLRAERPTQQL